MTLLTKIFLPLTLTVSLFADINTNELKNLNVGALMIKDLNSKEVLYSKSPEKKLSPASLTKIMTSILALEAGNLDRKVVITRAMTMVKPTIAGLKKGDTVSLRDLIYSAMIKSDNDSALSIAIAVGGNEKTFVAMMNQKARLIGMTNTHFENPTGFDGKQHYSTPQDLLKLAEYAIKNPQFNIISNKENHTYSVVSASGEKKTFKAFSHNKLLKRYPYAVGIKTGFTNRAGACLIARAKKDGKDCLIVMMNSKVDRWNTSKHIFEKLFDL